MGRKVSEQTRLNEIRTQAERHMKQWQLDGKTALENGNTKWAQECFVKAGQWKKRMESVSPETFIAPVPEAPTVKDAIVVKEAVSVHPPVSPSQKPINAITREGVAIRVGQIWRDLDRRNGNRFCKVKTVKDGIAHMQRCKEDGTEFDDIPEAVPVLTMHRCATGWRLIR